MYRDDVRLIKEENREVKYLIYKDILVLYIKSKLFLKDDKCCKRLIELFHLWEEYSYNELEILNYIKKKYGKYDEVDSVDLMLDELDEIYNNMFFYYDKIFSGYEDAIMMREVWRSNFSEPRFTKLNNDYKVKCLEKLRCSDDLK